MEKNDFIYFAIEYLTEQIPHLIAVPTKDEFAIDFSYNGQSDTLFLENLYRDFCEHNTTDIFLAAISVLRSFDRYDKKTILSTHAEQIIPHIRHKASIEEKVTFHHQELNEEIDLFFAIDLPDRLLYITKEMVASSDADYIEQTAFHNLFRRGWSPETMEEQTKFGVMYLYQQESSSFLGQFFVPSLTVPVLGEEFYLCLPTRRTAIAFTVDPMSEETPIGIVLKLKELAVKIHLKEAHPISEKIFHFKGDEMSVLG